MAVLKWDQVGERIYETGVDHGVLYLQDTAGEYNTGVAWNGLTTVTESPTGADPTPLYADNIKYINLLSVEEFGGTIEAYTYPDEFAQCDGGEQLAEGVVIGQQSRKPFGLSYRTNVGDDVKGQDAGYKLHLVYGATASPSDKSYSTINDSPDAINFSWEFSTAPVAVTGHKPTSTLVIDSTKVEAAKLQAIEELLYGTDTETAKLPMPDEIINLLAETPAG